MHLLNALLENLLESLAIIVLLSELTADIFSMHHYAYAQFPLGKALIILSDSDFNLNLQQSSSLVHSLHWLDALLAELHKTPQRSCLQLCFSIHNLASKAFSNLEVFLPSC
jgi:hypothetical protein